VLCPLPTPRTNTTLCMSVCVCRWVDSGVWGRTDTVREKEGERCPMFNRGKSSQIVRECSQIAKIIKKRSPNHHKINQNWCPERPWQASGEVLGPSWGEDAKMEGPKHFHAPLDPPFLGALGHPKGRFVRGWCIVFGCFIEVGFQVEKVTNTRQKMSSPTLLNCVRGIENQRFRGFRRIMRKSSENGVLGAPFWSLELTISIQKGVSKCGQLLGAILVAKKSCETF